MTTPHYFDLSSYTAQAIPIPKCLFGRMLLKRATPFAAQEAVETDNDEGDAEQLPLVETNRGAHGLLPRLLHLLAILHEEAEGEDGRQAVAEEEACADALAVLPVQPEAHEEEDEVGNGLVQLSRVARKGFVLAEHGIPVVGKDESPVRARIFADNLGVHEVAEADAARRDGRGDGDIIDHAQDIQFCAPHVEPEREDDAECAAMGSQARVAHQFPAFVGLLDGEQHLNRMREEIARLVEQAMAQARADEDADEAVEEERVELLGRNLLLAVEAIDNEIGQRQSQTPHQRIPTYFYRAKRQGYLRGRPNNHDKRGLLSETRPKPVPVKGRFYKLV